jgi:RNA-directed DNA polymerase
LEQPLKDGRMTEEIAKSFPVHKRMVWEAYKQVKSNRGSAGIDAETIEQFDANVSGNLYKIWNRMASGSYFPSPVRTVFIPKKQGGKRPLGIPTVSDRIAQTVVKQHLEANVDAGFHSSSFGYRPGRSAHDAIRQCEKNCLTYDWVIDLDIRGFFDNIDHEVMLNLLRQHTDKGWVLLYITRWLKAGVEQEDGSIQIRVKGTPQGGVISPLLANIYLHHVFDQWMRQTYPELAFERYADDCIVHCRSEREVEVVLEQIRQQLAKYKLELNDQKTCTVYCQDYRRKERPRNRSFDFLGFTLKPRTLPSKGGGTFLVFRAGISQKAKRSIRAAIRKVINRRSSHKFTLEWFAQALNAKLRGWMNYFGAFLPGEIRRTLRYVNICLCLWLRACLKLHSWRKGYSKLKQIQTAQPSRFYHWTIGIKDYY